MEDEPMPVLKLEDDDDDDGEECYKDAPMEVSKTLSLSLDLSVCQLLL